MEHEHAKEEAIIREIAHDFNRWFNEKVSASGVGMGVVAEILGILYTRSRVHMFREDAEDLMQRVVYVCEKLIEDGHLQFVSNGERHAYRPRESFATEDEKNFFIEASWGLSDADYEALLADD